MFCCLAFEPSAFFEPRHSQTGGKQVALYRLNILCDDQVVDHLTVVADTDADAQRKAKDQLRHYSDVWDTFELWQEARRVCSLDKGR